jgi:hypothetical protein
MHESAAPHPLNRAPSDEPADGEVCVQPVPGLVPLRHPYIRERLAAQLVAQRPEELGKVAAERARVMAAFGPRT